MTSADQVEELAEYEPRLLPLPADTARLLVSASGGRVTVTPAPEGGFVVQPQQYVGVVTAPGLQLLIRPKVPMENLFLMLGAGLPPDAWRPERFPFATSPHLLGAFAAFFARTCESVLARGLLRGYRTHAERLLTLRGRVDLVRQLRRPGVDIPVACTYDELTADVLENRVVKAALRRLLRVQDVGVDVQRSLRRELHRFEAVADVAPDIAAAEQLTYTRLNRHYEPLIRLALLVLRDVTLRHASGRTVASAFLLDMNALFQRFVTARLRAALRGRLQLAAEPLVHLGERRAVPMQPDLVFSGARGGYVGDVKYKLLGGTTGRSADYYQLLAYATALSLREGILVYCSSAGPKPPGVVQVRATGHLLHTWQIPLSGSRAEVERSFAELAGWIVHRSRNLAAG